MLPVLFEVGALRVHSFGALVLVAFVAGGFVLRRGLVQRGAPGELAWWIVALGAVGGLVGARLHLAIEHWGAFREAPLTLLASASGLVWYGGLLGGILASLWPIRRTGLPLARAADAAAPALALGLAIGRVGCHLAGDGDWGSVTALPWGVAYTRGIAPWPHPPGIAVHPAPLYESAALLVVFAGLLRLERRRRSDGQVFAIYLVASALVRFAVELVRTNPALALGMSEAQWTSLALAAGGGLWLWSRARRV